MKLIPAIFIFALNTCLLHGQQIYPPKIKFLVDSTIRPNIDKSITKEGLCSMDVQMFVNDQEKVNTFEKEKKAQFIMHTHFYKDTLYVLGFAGMFSGFGFYLDMHGDSSRVTLYAATDGPEVYKLLPSDTSYQRKLSVATTSCSLTLTKRPEYKDGEIVEGFVELDSHEFYSKSNGEQSDDKLQARISAYFRTQPIEIQKK